MFTVGDKVVYPSHGVGRIEGVEEKEIAGQKVTCYVLSIIGKDLKIIVPTFNAQKVGLRQIIQEPEVERVFDILSDEINNMPPKWNKRYNFNLDKIRTGSIYEIAEVFKNLTRLGQKKELSFGERKMLDSTRELIVMEIAHSKKIGTAQAESLINKCCAAA
ncbi:CarD family transcriptional regulator [candidate division KSB3 bacterium]|uniref:CarD family transcriptional regulator n=1 Tax=candidate division KSB3 bacterium TaxID=2044937 RepID=A0A2G6EAD8_9BACT|nr:MAG: CarD family transcriptional regulator [candidate division KSB3 bacterium]PIE30789.1 MAG: CarD family transcriptional regulator [candidate division KSB3 bacterium]